MYIKTVKLTTTQVSQGQVQWIQVEHPSRTHLIIGARQVSVSTWFHVACVLFKWAVLPHPNTTVCLMEKKKESQSYHKIRISI